MSALSAPPMAPDAAAAVLVETEREAALRSAGTVSSTRRIPTISLHDFEARRDEISDELWTAAANVGFFQLVNHGIDMAEVDRAFAEAADFFSLPHSTKEPLARSGGQVGGWESSTETPPSTGRPDPKETFHYFRPDMRNCWPSEEEVPGFRKAVDGLEMKCWRLAVDLLSCLAEKLGFDREFFTRAHSPTKDTYQSVLRLLHYPAPEARDDDGDGPVWRNGAHTDFGTLTLLFQRDGQGGLEVLPGADMHTQVWTPVVPSNDAITCNIGDMLMRWSDNRLGSTFHRVRMPGPDEAGPRYSIAYFAEADKDVVIESPRGSYPPIRADEFVKQRVGAYYS